MIYLNLIQGIRRNVFSRLLQIRTSEGIKENEP